MFSFMHKTKYLNFNYFIFRFMVGHKLLSYSFYDFVSRNSMLGFSYAEDLEKAYLNSEYLYN